MLHLYTVYSIFNDNIRVSGWKEFFKQIKQHKHNKFGILFQLDV